MDLNSLKDQASQALNSDKGEELTDKGLAAAAEMIKKATGGRMDEQIDQARQVADDRLGKA